MVWTSVLSVGPLGLIGLGDPARWPQPGGGPVGEPLVGPVVVVVDVGADRGAGVVEGLGFLAPDAALLELCEAGLDERLAFGVAVAAAAVGDGVLGQAGPERPAGECGRVVGPERQ